MMVMDKSYSSSITFFVFGQSLDVSLKNFSFPYHHASYLNQILRTINENIINLNTSSVFKDYYSYNSCKNSSQWQKEKKKNKQKCVLCVFWWQRANRQQRQSHVNVSLSITSLNTCRTQSSLLEQIDEKGLAVPPLSKPYRGCSSHYLIKRTSSCANPS